jgi:hypothetical protein
LGEPDTAIVEFRHALEHDCGNAEAHWNLSLALLQTGCLQEGWTEYEWRFRQWPGLARDFAAPLWDGGPLNGRRILLHAEQGIGDTLQFVRYADFAKRQGGWVVVECHPALVPLLRRMANVDEVVARDAGLPPFDCHAPLMSLPRIAGTKLDTIPGDVPYIAADDATVESWRTRVRGHGDGPCVGLAWAGNSRQRNDAKRSLGAGELALLDGLSGIQFFSLQKDERVPVEELRPAMIPLAREFRDFQDTAAAMAHLDLIVTVDTAVAHLAGALGRPVWTILPHAADWRWLQGREDSPWYPSMRLFRQVEAGEWGPVMRRVRNQLQALNARI